MDIDDFTKDMLEIEELTRAAQAAVNGGRTTDALLLVERALDSLLLAMVRSLTTNHTERDKDENEDEAEDQDEA